MFLFSIEQYGAEDENGSASFNVVDGFEFCEEMLKNNIVLTENLELEQEDLTPDIRG